VNASRRSCTTPRNTVQSTRHSTNTRLRAATTASGRVTKKLRITNLVDTDSQAVLDVRCLTTREGSDADIAEQIARRNAGNLRPHAADRGYHKQLLRESLGDLGIRLLIKHRIFTPYDHAHNARTDE